jgi:hypothetical protein
LLLKHVLYVSLQVKDRPEVQEKLQRRIDSTEVKIMNPPRPGAQLHRAPQHLPSAERLELVLFVAAQGTTASAHVFAPWR